MSKMRVAWITVSLKKPSFVFGLISWLIVPGLAQTHAFDVTNQNSTNPKNTVVATIPVGDGPFCAVVSPDSKTVYVSNDLSNTVSVIDAATNTVTFTVPVPTAPDSLAITPDGLSLYVVCDGFPAVAVMDTATKVVTGELPTSQIPGTIAVSPDGKSAILADGSDIEIFDTATNQLSSDINLEDPLDAYAVVVSPDGRYAFVLTSINGGLQGGLLRINLASHTQKRLAWGRLQEATNVTITPDGKTLYVGMVVTRSGEDRTQIAVYDLQQDEITDEILLPGKNTFGGIQPAITPDGKYLYYPHSDVFMVDTITNRAVGSPITVGYGLFAVAIAPNGKTAYAVSTNGYPTSGSRPGQTPYGVVSVIDITLQ
jgi:YVTN family beta-propeller protein